MQFTYRKNPATKGWARRIAIAILTGSGAMLLTAPLAFLLFLHHFESAYPNDTQNVLSALTVSVAIGLGVAVLAGSASVLLSVFLGFHRPTSDTQA